MVEGEGVSTEPERVLRGQRGEPKGLNRFQQLAAQSRGSPPGKKEDVEMSLIRKRKCKSFTDDNITLL